MKKGDVKTIGEIYITRLLDKGYRLSVSVKREHEDLLLTIWSLIEDENYSYTEQDVILETYLASLEDDGRLYGVL